MDEKNELSDIILDKGNASGSNKKIILTIATLGVVLIVVLMFMSSVNSDSASNLPHAVLPPKPQKEAVKESIQEEPLFEEVQVLEDDSSTGAGLDKITQRVKEKSQTEVSTAPVKRAPVATKRVNKPVKTTTKKVAQTTTDIKYYIQVGSFSRYEPNKKFLRSIENLGFNYEYRKVSNLNKVLVGPFNTRREANSVKRVLRAKVEPGAFLVKL